MTPERIDIGTWCTLYHADSTEILDVLREHEPEAIVMDPPYGIGHVTGEQRPREKHNRINRAPVHGDDCGPTLAPWLGAAREVMLWGADHLRRQLPDGGRFVAWNKTGGIKPWGDDFCDVEFGWHSRKGAAGIVSHMWKGVCTDQTLEREGNVRHHPMQKPIRVMQWCIRECRLEPGSTILDPYMGSGTTGIAAFGMDMKFVGVEIERRWFDSAVKRITERCDAGLFTAP